MGVCRTYASFIFLNYFNKIRTTTESNEFAELNYDDDFQVNFGDETKQKNILGAGSIWLTITCGTSQSSKEFDEAWKFYDSSLKIAWKSRDKFQNRDAWAMN
jgi:penicillin-binding protein 1C